MPKIPRPQADAIIRSPGLSPSAMAAPSAALAQAGREVASEGRYAFRMIRYIEEKERQAARTAKALEDELYELLEEMTPGGEVVPSL